MRKYTRTEIKLLQTEHVCIDDRFFYVSCYYSCIRISAPVSFFVRCTPMKFVFNTMFDYYEWNDRKQIESQIFFSCCSQMMNVIFLVHSFVHFRLWFRHITRWNVRAWCFAHFYQNGNILFADLCENKWINKYFYHQYRYTFAFFVQFDRHSLSCTFVIHVMMSCCAANVNVVRKAVVFTTALFFFIALNKMHLRWKITFCRFGAPISVSCKYGYSARWKRYDKHKHTSTQTHPNLWINSMHYWLKFVRCKSTELGRMVMMNFPLHFHFSHVRHITQILLLYLFCRLGVLPTVSEVARTRSVSCKWLNSNYGVTSLWLLYNETGFRMIYTETHSLVSF